MENTELLRHQMVNSHSLSYSTVAPGGADNGANSVRTASTGGEDSAWTANTVFVTGDNSLWSPNIVAVADDVSVATRSVAPRFATSRNRSRAASQSKRSQIRKAMIASGRDKKGLHKKSIHIAATTACFAALVLGTGFGLLAISRQMKNKQLSPDELDFKDKIEYLKSLPDLSTSPTSTEDTIKNVQPPLDVSTSPTSTEDKMKNVQPPPDVSNSATSTADTIKNVQPPLDVSTSPTSTEDKMKNVQPPPDVSNSATSTADTMFQNIQLSSPAPTWSNRMNEAQAEFLYDCADPQKDGPLSFIKRKSSDDFNDEKDYLASWIRSHGGDTLGALRAATMSYILPLHYDQYTQLLREVNPNWKPMYLDTSQKIKALPGIAHFKEAYDHYGERPEMLTRYVIYILSGKQTPLSDAHKVKNFEKFCNRMEKNMHNLDDILARLPGTDIEHDVLVRDRKINGTKPLLFKPISTY
eukprot:GHVT01060284.1.p1 GENE.GHVT01060284.1~~GHVT01060284.1.p1  ORF type:complete len:469 (+),score=34.84 GHVT01060284.1:195-1601(+)